MDINELNYHERGLIEILRAFKFLHEEKYTEKEINISGRDSPTVIYHNWIVNQVLSVIGDESQSWSIVIQRKKAFALKKESVVFDISDYYEYFKSGMIKGRNYTLKAQAEFIQMHLMPVIRGEKWIDEIITNSNQKQL